MLLGIGAQQLAVRRDHVSRQQVVDGQTEGTHQEAHASTKGDAADTHRTGVPETQDQPVGAKCGGDGRRVEPRLGPDRLPRDVDVDAGQLAQVEHESAVDAAVTGVAVASAADRKGATGLACEVHHAGHVRGVGDLGDGRRARVRAAQEHGARLVVAGVARFQHAALQCGPKIGDGVSGRGRRGSLHGSDAIACVASSSVTPPFGDPLRRPSLPLNMPTSDTHVLESCT